MPRFLVCSVKPALWAMYRYLTHKFYLCSRVSDQSVSMAESLMHMSNISVLLPLWIKTTGLVFFSVISWRIIWDLCRLDYFSVVWKLYNQQSSYFLWHIYLLYLIYLLSVICISLLKTPEKRQRDIRGFIIKKLSVISADIMFYGYYDQVGLYTRKIGPKTEPWGTPQVMSGEEDDKLPTVTAEVLWEMQ